MSTAFKDVNLKKTPIHTFNVKGVTVDNQIFNAESLTTALNTIVYNEQNHQINSPLNSNISKRSNKFSFPDKDKFDKVTSKLKGNAQSVSPLPFKNLHITEKYERRCKSRENNRIKTKKNTDPQLALKQLFTDAMKNSKTPQCTDRMLYGNNFD
jgi:hypothetical protein